MLANERRRMVADLRDLGSCLLAEAAVPSFDLDGGAETEVGAQLCHLE